MSCMAILRGVIYSQSVTVILEYVDLLRHIGIISLTDYQTCEITTIIIPLSGIYQACMAILRGVIYSQSVTVILEYVDLLRHIGSRVFAAKLCLSWLAMFY